MAVKLEASDFAVAGAREGVGPVLGVDPQRQDLNPGLTGLVTSVAGIAGIVASAPLGPFLDRAASQGTALIVAVLGIATGAGVVAQTAGFPAAFAILDCIAALGLAARLAEWRAVGRGRGASLTRVGGRL